MFVDEKKMLIDFFCGGGCVSTGPVRMHTIHKKRTGRKQKKNYNTVEYINMKLK